MHAPADNDAALIAAVRRGDAGSREALYHRFKRRVYALAVRIVGPNDAEEVSQEAFIRIFRGLEKFRGDAALATWIYRLAVNAALSHRSRRGTGPQPEADDDVDAQVGAEPVRGDAVLRVRIERALVRLPVGYRTVIVLHDIEGLEHEEIAQILGCHVGTSKSQLHKARAPPARDAGRRRHHRGGAGERIAECGNADEERRRVQDVHDRAAVGVRRR